MNDQTVSTGPALKKTYQQPSFVRYGSIAKLTQANNGSGTDGSGVPGMSRLSCL